MNATLHLHVDATEEPLFQAMNQVEAFVSGHDLPPGLAFAIQLTVEELGTNIVKYSGAPSFTMELQLAGRPTLTLRDSGRPFDPWSDATLPDLDQPLEERPIGGLGLHMIRQLAAACNYQRLDHQNIITVTFNTE